MMLLQYVGFLLGSVGAANAPFFWVEVVGTIAEVVREAYWRALVGEQHIAARGVGQGDGFAAHICDGLGVSDFGRCKSVGVELRA